MADLAVPMPEDEDERMHRLRAYKVLDTARELAFDRFVFTAAQMLRTPIALITLVDSRRQWFKAQVGMTLAETDRDIAFCAHTILSDGPMMVVDATQDPRFATNPLVVGGPRLRFYAGAPLITPQGQKVGTICVLDHRPRTLSPLQLSHLQLLATSVVRQLESQKPTSESDDLD